jgi:hypothetical protein
MRNRMHVQAMALATAVVVGLLTGCASTTLQSTWVDPAFTGGPFKKVFVMGLARNVTARRVFEDIMVAKLQAAGVQAVPAYRFIPGDSAVPEPSFDAAVAKSGADAVMMTRLLGIETQTNVSTMMVPGPVVGPRFGPGFGPGWGAGWWGPYNAWYAVPQVTQYQIATAETTLYDVRTKRLVWTAISQTFNPQSVQTEAPGLADAVIGALRARGLIAG